jgi:hypothetical protein
LPRRVVKLCGKSRRSEMSGSAVSSNNFRLLLLLMALDLHSLLLYRSFRGFSIVHFTAVVVTGVDAIISHQIRSRIADDCSATVST